MGSITGFLTTGRRQDFQPESFRNLHQARDVLPLLRVFADGHHCATLGWM
jgi:hypothetical protein